MTVTIASDSFKGSLSTLEVGTSIAEGIRRVCTDAEIFVRPIADGGEGTVDAIADGKICEKVCIQVTGPLGNKISAEYVTLSGEDGKKTAFIEMSAAAGITLVPENLRDPLVTTTFGVGEMIKHAIASGCRDFIIGIGGSATNDGGVGMLSALGFEFLDCGGNAIAPCASGLEGLFKICGKNAVSELCECRFTVACDVKNPLCGNDGCSKIYGPQKGATPEMIDRMDAWLLSFAELTRKFINGQADPGFPGVGAAGGMGFALKYYLGATLMSGIDLVIEKTGLEEYISKSDIVITGEGRLDGQTHMGKAPVGVAGIAKKYGKRVIAFSGGVTRDAVLCNDHGIDAFFPVVRTPCNLSEAMEKETAKANISDTVEQVFRLIAFVH